MPPQHVNVPVLDRMLFEEEHEERALAFASTRAACVCCKNVEVKTVVGSSDETGCSEPEEVEYSLSLADSALASQLEVF